MSNMFNGQKLKQIRKARGLTQSELGKLIGVTKVSICGYETGNRTPSLEQFCWLVDVLEISADTLLVREYDGKREIREINQ